MTNKLKVGIIGAGIQGVCNALFLQKKGHQVTLFDREDPGSQSASYGNAGHFSPYASIPLNRPDIITDVPAMLLSSTGPLELKWNHAIYGEDTMGTHYGKNIFLSDLEAQNEGQQYSYGNFNGQGIKTTQDYVTATISHPIKQSKIYLYGQLISRQISSDLQDVNHLYFLIGIRTNLHNSYLDF